LLVPKGVALERPLHVLWFATDGLAGAPAATFPRLLLVAEEASSATVVESYASTEETIRLVAPFPGPRWSRRPSPR